MAAPRPYSPGFRRATLQISAVEGHGDSTYSTVPFIQLDQQTVIIGDGGRILPSAPPSMKIELTFSSNDGVWKVRDLSPSNSLIVDNQVVKEALVAEGDVLSFGTIKKSVGSYAKPTSGTTYVLLWEGTKDPRRTKMGFSYKLGGWKKAEWQKRWLVLETWNTLYWFKSQGDGEPKGQLSLKDVRDVKECPESQLKANFVMEFVTDKKPYHLKFDQESDRAAWMKTIRERLGAKASAASVGSGSSGRGSGQESVSPGLTNKYGSLQKNWVIDFAQIKMVEQIGVGRLGEVWKGRWRASPVAVKKLNTQFLTPQQIDELNGSVGSLITMKGHKNIAQFLGICTEPLCLVSDFYRDGSLYNFLGDFNKTMDENDVKRFAKDICCAMAHLHQEGIVHRDLNSKNCLLDSSSGQLGIRLCDFGIALPVTDQNDEKVRWLAPEVLTQQRYSFKSDVYAFGITMIEILTRYTPWNGFTPQDVMYAVTQQYQVHSLPENTPEPLNNLIPPCFSYNPDQRPDFAMLLDNLEQKDEGTFVPAEDCMPPDKASQVPGYRGALERPQAETDLRKINQPGVYLVRWSAKQKFYSVSYISSDLKIVHFGNIVLDKKHEVVRIPTDHGAFKFYNNFLDFLTDYKIHGVFTTPIRNV